MPVQIEAEAQRIDLSPRLGYGGATVERAGIILY